MSQQQDQMVFGSKNEEVKNRGKRRRQTAKKWKQRMREEFERQCRSSWGASDREESREPNPKLKDTPTHSYCDCYYYNCTVPVSYRRRTQEDEHRRDGRGNTGKKTYPRNVRHYSVHVGCSRCGHTVRWYTPEEALEALKIDFIALIRFRTCEHCKAKVAKQMMAA